MCVLLTNREGVVLTFCMEIEETSLNKLRVKDKKVTVCVETDGRMLYYKVGRTGFLK